MNKTQFVSVAHFVQLERKPGNDGDPPSIMCSCMQIIQTFFLFYWLWYKTTDECTSSHTPLWTVWDRFLQCISLLLGVLLMFWLVTIYSKSRLNSCIQIKDRQIQKTTANIDILLLHVWIFQIIFVLHDRKWVLSLGKEYLCDCAKWKISCVLYL